LQVIDFNKPSSSVSVLPSSGLKWQLSNAGISIRGDWHIKYRFIFPIKSSGWFEGRVSGSSISVSVTLGTTPSGQPTIRSTNCQCSISLIKIKLHGGGSWLYNLFMGSVQKTITNQLQKLVCVEARKAIDVTAERELNTLKTEVQVGNQLILDYRLVSSPAFGADYFDTFLLGEFFFVGDPAEAPFLPAPLPNPPTASRMVTFWISNYVLNTAGYALHKHGALRLTVTKANLPPGDKNLLDLTCCAKCKCIGKMIPEAGKLYPDASVEVELSTILSPTVLIGTSNISATFIGTAILRARLTNSSLVYLLKAKVSMKPILRTCKSSY
jgi:lipopolysaccharide-binding protein